MDFKSLFDLYEKKRLQGRQKKTVDVFFSRMQHNGIKENEVDDKLEQKLYAGIKKRIQPETKLKVWIKIAAIMLVLVGVGSFLKFNLFSTKDKGYITVTATEGKQLSIVLSDATKVVLNAGSMLTYPEHFTGNQRNVELSGEGYFEVVKNPSMPFSVTSGTFETKVLGTKFLVSDSEVDMPGVSVLSGKVRVTENNSKEVVVLVKNEKVQFDKNTGHLIKSEMLTEQQPMFWEQVEFRFKNADMKKVIDEINKRFKVTVSLKTPENDCDRISGKFSGKTVESILKGIQFINSMTFEQISEKEFNVYLAPCKE